MKLNKNKESLRREVNQSQFTQEQIDNISNTLEKSLRRFGGIGMSANQLGLPYRACIINVKEPLVLINPRIVETSQESVVYRESCLSIPRTMRSPVNTIRYKTFTVECDNLGTVLFSPDKENWETPEDFWNDEGMLECVVAQHELDHLNGILITDIERRYNRTYKSTTPKRNERVMVRLEDGSTEFVKYKFVRNSKGEFNSPFVEIL
jgi:peptide deformylase